MTINPLASAALESSFSPAERSADQTAQRRQLVQAIQQINGTSAVPEGHEISIFLDPATKQPVTKLVDSQTREVISQIPAEYILRIAGFFEAQAAQEKHAQTPDHQADM